MGLFRDRTVRIDQHGTDGVHAPGRPWSLWADAFGALAIRAVQIIVVVALAGDHLGIRQLTVVTIPP
jgi:hypothetical protein